MDVVLASIAEYVLKILPVLAPFAWPAVVVLLSSKFRAELGRLIDRINGIEALGTKLSLADRAAASAIAAASPTALIKKPIDNIEWLNVGNLWWLCNDLLTCNASIVGSAPPGDIAELLARVHNHAWQLGVDRVTLDKLKTYAKQANAMMANDWTPSKKNEITAELRELFNSIGQQAILKQNATGETHLFKTDPIWSDYK